MIENIRLSFKGILSHKIRSFLTMLGIIIGIAAIIAVLLTMAFSYVASFVWNPEKHRAKETQK